ncbi:MAG: hypothetical protein DRI92_03535 [Aquificota bacterium]|nr:MAG: hypothetical protein DRI92_03535 [Aquificota bacterium]
MEHEVRERARRARRARVDQVIGPGIALLDWIVEQGDLVEVPPVVGQQRVIYTEHSLWSHPCPFQAIQQRQALIPSTVLFSDLESGKFQKA